MSSCMPAMQGRPDKHRATAAAHPSSTSELSTALCTTRCGEKGCPYLAGAPWCCNGRGTKDSR